MIAKRYEIVNPEGRVIGIVRTANEEAALKAYYVFFGRKEGLKAVETPVRRRA